MRFTELRHLILKLEFRLSFSIKKHLMSLFLGLITNKLDQLVVGNPLWG